MANIKIKYSDREHLDADLNRFIESGNETEMIAARMLKAVSPVAIEIAESKNLAYLAGFVRGITNIVASMTISLPPRMRKSFGEILKREVSNAIDIAKKGPPR